MYRLTAGNNEGFTVGQTLPGDKPGHTRPKRISENRLGGNNCIGGLIDYFHRRVKSLSPDFAVAA